MANGRVTLYKCNEKVGRRCHTDNALLTSVPTALGSRDVEVVEILNHSLQETNMEWHPPSSYAAVSAKLCKSFASISDMSRALAKLQSAEHQDWAFLRSGGDSNDDNVEYHLVGDQRPTALASIC
jgi:hypothetical protein